MNSTENVTGIGLSHKSLHEYNDEEAARRVIPVIYLSVLMTIGIPGNILVLLIYSTRLPKGTHTLFITGLAVADLLVCLVTLPFEITEMRYQYTFYNKWACKFFRSCNNLFSLSSIFILMGLSGDRFRRVCTPLKLQMTTRQATVLIISSVILSLMFSWPNFFISGIRLVQLDSNVTGYDCSLSDKYAKTKIPIIYGGVLFLIFIICMISLIIIYSLIGYRLCTHIRFRRTFSRVSNSTSTTAVSNESHQMISAEEGKAKEPMGDRNVKVEGQSTYRTSKQKKSKRHTEANRDIKSNKLTKIAFTISVAFIVSYLPHLTISLLTALKGKFLFPPGPVVSAVLPIVTRSFAINNIVNPIIYGFMDKRFRNQLWFLFKRRR